jgi:hypothetical protein
MFARINRARTYPLCTKTKLTQLSVHTYTQIGLEAIDMCQSNPDCSRRCYGVGFQDMYKEIVGVQTYLKDLEKDPKVTNSVSRLHILYVKHKCMYHHLYLYKKFKQNCKTDFVYPACTSCQYDSTSSYELMCICTCIFVHTHGIFAERFTA